MMLPDVNVLIYAFRKDVPQHAESRRWLVGIVEGDFAGRARRARPHHDQSAR